MGWWCWALLVALASAAEPGAAEKHCRDRYDAGTPAQAAAACARCVQAEPENAVCAAAVRYIKERPRLAPKGGGNASGLETWKRAQQHYLSGIIYFQKDDGALAREEWKTCLKLDAANADCASALDYLEGKRKTIRAPGTPGPSRASDAPRAASDEQARGGQQHYLSGMIFYQKAEYARASQEWRLCLKLDPYNYDCASGIERVRLLYGEPDWKAELESSQPRRKSLGKLDKDSSK